MQFETHKFAQLNGFNCVKHLEETIKKKCNQRVMTSLKKEI